MKYIKIFFKFIVAVAAVISIIGLVDQLSGGLFKSSSEIFSNSLPKFPQNITAQNKNEVYSVIDSFIKTREKAINETLNHFQTLCNELDMNHKIINEKNYTYGEILRIELNHNTSTAEIVENFLRKNPYGAYVSEQDIIFFDRKLELIESHINKSFQTLNEKYRDGFTISNDSIISFKMLKNMFLNIYSCKLFLKNDLKQSDIDEYILKVKNNLLNGFSIGTYHFPKVPSYWKSIVKKEKYDKSMPSPMYTIIALSSNNKYLKLSKEQKFIVDGIIHQGLTSFRFGYVYVKFNDMGINNYFGEDLLLKIDKMIDLAIKKVGQNSHENDSDTKKLKNTKV